MRTPHGIGPLDTLPGTAVSPPPSFLGNPRTTAYKQPAPSKYRYSARNKASFVNCRAPKRKRTPASSPGCSTNCAVP